MKTFQLGAGVTDDITYPIKTLLTVALDNRMVNIAVGEANVPPPPENRYEYANRLVGCRLDVERGKNPVEYFKWLDLDPTPAEFLQLAGVSPDDPVKAALFVEMDNPDQLMRAIIRWTQVSGIPLLDPVEAGSDYLVRNVRVMSVFNRICWTRMQQAFAAKYFYGMPRPEELICPNFGHYKAPWHPEYPAGHGTFAGVAEYVTKLFFDLSPAQVAILETGCRQLAHYRDLAGVHFAFSSDVGYQFGAGRLD